MTIGKYSYGCHLINILMPDPDVELTIGAFCAIAAGVTIYQGGDHRIDHITTYPFGNDIIKSHLSKTFNRTFDCDNRSFRGKLGVHIGNDVWLGNNITIMPGVKIGDGAVIGANSHVMGHIKPYTVNGGNPCQLYFYRFKPEIIKRLLEIRWWDWPDEYINEASEILCSNDFETLFNYYDTYLKH
jgi:acetyltransferase-like isoleucine patch superfamily enzyme